MSRTILLLPECRVNKKLYHDAHVNAIFPKLTNECENKPGSFSPTNKTPGADWIGDWFQPFGEERNLLRLLRFETSQSCLQDAYYKYFISTLALKSSKEQIHCFAYITRTLHAEFITKKRCPRLHILANFCIINYNHVLFKPIENTTKQSETLWCLASIVQNLR
jgi:hypothetical protein